MSAAAVGWLIGLIAALALAVAVGHPGVRRRWRARRRQRALEAAEARLDLGVPRFLLTRRARLLARLERDPEVRSLVRELAAGRPDDERRLRARVRTYAREIVPAFSLFFYFHLGYRLARGLLRLHYRVRTAHVDPRAARWDDPGATVVMILNHRSNMDVLLVNYLAAQRSTLSHAAGEWARLWPFSLLVRAAGNYVVDRRAGDALYRRVLARYVFMAARAGVPQAIFPEGELSRDGKLQPIKLGLLSYVIRAYAPDGGRDICFIPVAVNYDRVPEDRRLIRDPERTFQQRGKAHLALASRRYCASVARLAFKRREHRFGCACASFGAPVSLHAWLAGQGIDWLALDGPERHRHVAALARELLDRVAAMIPVLPVPLVAHLLPSAPERDWDEADLMRAADRLVDRLTAGGAHLCLPPGVVADAVRGGLRMLTQRGLVERTEGRIRTVAGQGRLITYYGNSIGHLIADPGNGA